MPRIGLVPVVAAALLLVQPAAAQPPAAPDETSRWRAFSGASVAEDSYYFYSGARAALSGDITRTGFILGFSSGSGLYRYASGAVPGGTIGGRFRAGRGGAVTSGPRRASGSR